MTLKDLTTTMLKYVGIYLLCVIGITLVATFTEMSVTFAALSLCVLYIVSTVLVAISLKFNIKFI